MIWDTDMNLNDNLMTIKNNDNMVMRWDKCISEQITTIHGQKCQRNNKGEVISI